MTAHLARDAADYRYAVLVHTAGLLRGGFIGGNSIDPNAYTPQWCPFLPKQGTP